MIETYIEKIKNLSEESQKEVFLFIDFMEQYDKGEALCTVQDVEKK